MGENIEKTPMIVASSRHTWYTTAVALALKYAFPAMVFNGDPIRNGFSAGAASIGGSIIDRLINRSEMRFGDLLWPAFSQMLSTGLFTFVSNWSNIGFLSDLVSGDSYIYLAVFIFASQIVGDILYRVIKRFMPGRMNVL